jgi:large subunit ribosomal protein L24e
LEFEKRRNIPIRYDRNLMSTTLKAMKRIQEIKANRERVFYKQRMAGKKELEKEQALKEIQKNIELVHVPELVEKVLEHVDQQKQDRMDMETA